MSRAIWKGPFIDKFLLNESFLNKTPKIWSRRSIILSNLIGKAVLIHNGNTFKRILITREKVGFKFGEFCSTRTFIPKVKPLKKNKVKK